MTEDVLPPAVREALADRRRTAIWQGIVFIALELLLIVAAVAHVDPMSYVRPYLSCCATLTGMLDQAPPFHVVMCMAGLVIVMTMFGRFIILFDNQADLRKYKVKAIRPVPLTLLFIFSSLSTIIALFAVLYQWTKIYGDSSLVCKDNVCTLVSAEVENLWECLYFSIITITTVGYGDYHPGAGPLAHFIAASEALSGYVILGILVSSLSNMVRHR